MSRIYPPKTPGEISRYPRKNALIGSRAAPHYALDAMEQLARIFCDLGYLGLSGQADGMDTYAHLGAARSECYPDVGFAAFIPWDGYRSGHGQWFNNPEQGIYDASKFSTWSQAEKIALKARGSFNGLSRWGIKLHTRNAFQVMSPSLLDPVERVVCWAPPIGNGDHVRGGTNTAVQIARHFGVRVSNLYYQDIMEKVHAFISQHAG